MWEKHAAEDAAVNRLLDCLYDAAVNEDRWTDFCREAAVWFGGISMNVSLQTMTESIFVATHGMPEEISLLYPQHYWQTDPWTKAGLRLLRPMESACSSQLCPPRELERSEFYTDFLKRYSDIYWMIGAYVPLVPGEIGVLSIQRHRNAQEFTDQDKAKLDWLLPHIRRALMTRQQLRSQQRFANDMMAALDSVATPLFILQANGRVVHLNRAGEECVKRRCYGFWFTAGRRLEAADPAVSAKLHAEIRLACERTAQSDAQVISQSVPDCALAVLLVVSPLSTLGQARALLTIIDPNPHRSVFERALTGYGLTKAERDLVTALASGDALKTVADRKKIALATARTQLQQVLEKTDLHSQAALMRLAEAIRRDAPYLENEPAAGKS